MNALWPLWISALLLLLLTLGCLLWPLLREAEEACVEDGHDHLRRLYRTQRAELDREHEREAIDMTEHAQAIDELERRFLEEMSQQSTTTSRPSGRPWRRRLPAALLSLLLPLAAIALYLKVGDPEAAVTIAQGQSNGHVSTGMDVEAMVGRLEERLQQKPDDLEGWVVLARSREVMEEYPAATAAYQRAIALAKAQNLPLEFQARLHADLADALASARNGALDKPVQEVLDAALRLDPDQPKALALAGTAALREGRPNEAKRHWKRLLQLLEPDSDMALRVQNDLTRIDDRGSSSAAPPRGTISGLAGSISLDPMLHDRVKPDDIVFIVVRAPKNGRMPVAVLRMAAGQLPAQFTLDDSNAMSPDTPLSRFDDLTIEARISRNGTAQRQPGQLISPPQTVQRGSNDLRLRIHSVEP